MKFKAITAKSEIVFILGIAILFLIGIEAATRTVILPKSRIETRTETEFMAAAAIRSNGQNHTLLMLGNSLLGEGVDMAALNVMLPAGWKARRLLVEDTSFYDWYYGMRNLFSKGSRPEVAVLMLNLKQLTSDGIRGEYSSYRLMNIGDLPELAWRLQLHPTAASGLLLGNVSAFYGARVEIRKQALAMVFPDLADLTKLMIPRQSAIRNEQFQQKEIQLRFNKLAQLASSHSIRMAFMIAPAPGMRNETLKAAIRLGVETNLDVLSPINPLELDSSDYSDGFHLNRIGAGKFTNALGRTLQSYLPKARHRGSQSWNSPEAAKISDY